jgi:hypothetical protein
MIENPLEYRQWIGEAIRGSLKTLLETKHLYQYVLVPLAELMAKIPDNLEYGVVRREASKAIMGLWFAAPPQKNSQQLPPRGRHESGKGNLVFFAPSVRLYCGRCKRAEPHDCEDTYSSETSYFLVYRCLGCRQGRVTFLVEREDLSVETPSRRLKLSGRYPFEQFAEFNLLPPFLAKYYSDAAIAFNSGFVGMGIFGLRTVIEQWARAVTGITTKVDGTELFDEYAKILPQGFSSLYPSLGAMYSALSADMHGAVGDSTLFESARADINKHFGALRSLSSPASQITLALSRKK